MFNARKPSLEELPSSAQLLRSTILAAIGAAAILLVVVLPAEYGIDPTGAGRVLGLTEMGEIKRELSEEAERDRKADAGTGNRPAFVAGLLDLFIGKAHAQQPDTWTDRAEFTPAMPVGGIGAGGRESSNAERAGFLPRVAATGSAICRSLIRAFMRACSAWRFSLRQSSLRNPNWGSPASSRPAIMMWQS